MAARIVSGTVVTYVQYLHDGGPAGDDDYWEYPKPLATAIRQPEDLEERTFDVWEGVLEIDGQEVPAKSEPFNKKPGSQWA